jgi:hypothetical protein
MHGETVKIIYFSIHFFAPSTLPLWEAAEIIL